MLAMIPVVVGLLAAVVPAAVAGEVPWPVRMVPLDAALHAAGPSPTAYPYRAGKAPTLDADGFVTGQCTSFVAWWLGVHGVTLGVMTVGPRGAAWFLNASTWDAAARAAGFRVGTRPVVGAIAQWHAGETSRVRDSHGVLRTVTASPDGHVAVVVRVLADGEAEWLDYGSNGHARLHQGQGVAPRYLYLGVSP